MAIQSDIKMRNQMIYCIYVRNHTEEGTFRAVEPDLKRIKELGTDIIWLMPIHPIGVKGKKGTLGCPYAIQDYRKVNPAYGSMEDFIHLTEQIHALGMKCIIDVVYNHTSQDSVLVKEHPEYFYHKSNGDFGNRCGEWADVYDLEYEVKELWDYQINTLKMWAQYVDGFRCDVASCVPVEFWIKARAAVETVRQDCIWLAESVHSIMVYNCRANGIAVWSDHELYQAFDIEYQYDIMAKFDAALNGTEVDMKHYLDALNFQEVCYPENYNKMRYLENHDTPRFASLIDNAVMRYHWLAFMFCQKGTAQIYAGQEYSNVHTPSLFEIDRMDPSGTDISEQIQRLCRVKKEAVPYEAMFTAKLADGTKGIVEIQYHKNYKTIAVGYFSLRGEQMDISVDLEDGCYLNKICGQEVCVREGKLAMQDEPILIILD